SRLVGLILVFVLGACGSNPVVSSSTLRDDIGPPTTPETTTTSPAETTTTAGVPSDDSTSLQSPLGLGRVIQVGDWLLRVSGVTPDATELVLAENMFNDAPEDGEQFFIANVEATYVGDDSATFWIDMSL